VSTFLGGRTEVYSWWCQDWCTIQWCHMVIHHLRSVYQQKNMWNSRLACKMLQWSLNN